MAAYWIMIGIMAVGALGFWHKLKLWSIVLIGFNLMFTTLLVVGLLEMLANLLDGAWGGIAYYSEMDIFIILFPLIFFILMLITAKITKANLYFEEKTDKIAKWIACFIVILGFSGTAGYVFYVIMPEKPKEISSLFTMQTLDFIANGSLKPLLSDDSFRTEDFVQRQMKRNAGVWIQTVDNDDWKFDGDSPNAQ